MTSHPGESSGFHPVVIGVLALQGDVREHLYALESAGAEAIPVRRERELNAVDALVIPGGESTTMDKLVRAFDLLEPGHQPRSDSRCGCGISSTLMPTIASPRPRDTLAMTSGSS